MQWVRDHLKILIPAAVVVVGLVAYLAFGVFGVQFLFIDDKVDEAAPVFASGASADESTTDEATDGAADTTTSAVATTAPPTTVPPTTTDAGSSDAGSSDAPATTPAPTTAPPTTVPPTTVPPTTAPQIVTLVEGTFIPRDHPGQGIAKVLTDGSSQRFLRFEQFSTDNGPVLYVYRTTADANASEGVFDDVGEYVALGSL
jgi:hypothetical protein